MDESWIIMYEPWVIVVEEYLAMIELWVLVDDSLVIMNQSRVTKVEPWDLWKLTEKIEEHRSRFQACLPVEHYDFFSFSL